MRAPEGKGKILRFPQDAKMEGLVGAIRHTRPVVLNAVKDLALPLPSLPLPEVFLTPQFRLIARKGAGVAFSLFCPLYHV